MGGGSNKGAGGVASYTCKMSLLESGSDDLRLSLLGHPIDMGALALDGAAGRSADSHGAAQLHRQRCAAAPPIHPPPCRPAHPPPPPPARWCQPPRPPPAATPDSLLAWCSHSSSRHCSDSTPSPAILPTARWRDGGAALRAQRRRRCPHLPRRHVRADQRAGLSASKGNAGQLAALDARSQPTAGRRGLPKLVFRGAHWMRAGRCQSPRNTRKGQFTGVGLPGTETRRAPEFRPP